MKAAQEAKEAFCIECGKLVSIRRNGLTHAHNDEATGDPCDGFWLCSHCGREYEGYNLPNECECGHKPAPSVFV